MDVTVQVNALVLATKTSDVRGIIIQPSLPGVHTDFGQGLNQRGRGGN